MNTRNIAKRNIQAFLIAAGFLMQAASAQALTVDVVGHDRAADQTTQTGSTPVTGYRWVLQEDATAEVTPGVAPAFGTAPLSGQFHASYMPVIASGTSSAADLAALSAAIDPTKRYYISVLPNAGYDMGGAPIAAGQAGVTIDVNAYALPTAQLSVLVFKELTINGAPDMPAEEAAAQGVDLSGFSILLFDAAGQYGMAGGQILEDIFGNPLGTTYQYNPDGTPAFDLEGNPMVDVMGLGLIMTDKDGNALIKNLAPGKYGVQAVPPAGEGWVQTSTIEGSKTIDVWIRANEPPFFKEFGPPGPHAFIGYVQTGVERQPTNNGGSTLVATGNNTSYRDSTRLTGGVTITGQVVNLHNSRPPEVAFYNGEPLPHSTCWVGLNDMGLVSNEVIYAQRCDDTNGFAVPDVPDGQYQLVIWDDYLMQIIAFYTVNVAGGQCSTPTGSCNLIEVPVFNWFSRLENYVFLDQNENGYRDEGEPGIPEQNINLRFRDGRIYQAFPTDMDGYVPFDEVFPFFSWLVAEIDYGRFNATGVTYIVDDGGAIPANDPFARGTQNPQPQPENDGLPYRTIATALEGAPPLTLAFQGFLGQNNTMEWGKKPYAAGQNGGISGMVFYAVTRAEDDPRYAAAEEWEPGIPRVQVNLYEDRNQDGVIDDSDKNLVIELADIDNYPLGWSEGGAKGPEDLDRNGNGVFDRGDAIRFTHTDSWDDNQPSGCVGDPYVLNGAVLDCYDNMRVYNQIREGVFDGGYAFGSVSDPLLAGTYIVEAATPPGYELLKEEDRNVDFGDVIAPAPQLLPAACVGDLHLVPANMTMQTDPSDPTGKTALPGIDPAELIPAPFAGTNRPLCDRKQIRLADRTNAAVDFFLFTHTPVASQGFGFSLNDLANEFNAANPQFGEKFAPPYLPVGVRDWTGRLLSKTYTDGMGRYNMLVPSTHSAAGPFASGMSPNMLQICMNDAGPIRNPNFGQAGEPEFIADPYFDPQYSQFCYTLMFMPGATTYLDTPVLPVAGFAGGKQPDCECEDGRPAIRLVNSIDGGPLVVNKTVAGTITIESRGLVSVPNPAYTPPDPVTGLAGPEPKTIVRDYGFGTGGTVTLGGVALPVVSWSADTIVATVPAGSATGELLVTRADTGKTTLAGVTLTVGLKNIIYGKGQGTPVPQVVHHVTPGPGAIQSAIDAAAPGDIVMVAPGTYNEQVIMWKPVQLQGWGAGSVTLDAQDPTGALLIGWQNKLAELAACDGFEVLTGQTTDFATEQGAGLLVLKWKKANAATGICADLSTIRDSSIPAPRIDGFSIVGGSGGGIVVNGKVANLGIGNNRMENNSSPYAGAVRSGSPVLTAAGAGGLVEYVDSLNDNLNIHHNQIVRNGAISALGSGGGIALFTGSDRYSVTDNLICGNFSNGDGGGISHLGLNGNNVSGYVSRPNLIARNSIIFNQSFNQGLVAAGGGVSIKGQAPVNADTPYSPGAGSVSINANLIQGNLAGSGAGGGIYVDRFNGGDIAANGGGNPSKWFTLGVTNNIVANNVAGAEAGGISLQDAVLTTMHHNSVANNDSTATAGASVVAANPNTSLPQPAGLVSHAHTSEIVLALSAGGVWNNPAFPEIQDFSRPAMSNNIFWQNRAFHFQVTADQLGYELALDGYDDLGVLGVPAGPVPCMTPRYSILTDLLEDAAVCYYDGVADANQAADPAFVLGYHNADQSVTLPLGEVTNAAPQVAGAADEGGNFLDVRFGPLALGDSNYHIADTSPAIGAGNGTVVSGNLTTDIDGDIRPSAGSTAPDIGADENALATPVSPLL